MESENDNTKSSDSNKEHNLESLVKSMITASENLKH